MRFVAKIEDVIQSFLNHGIRIIDSTTYFKLPIVQQNWGIEDVVYQHHTITFFIFDKKKFFLKLFKYGIQVNESNSP